MSTLCDSCKQTVHQEDGYARIVISDPTPDLQSISVEALPTHRYPPQIDLCANCLTKLIEVLSLPPDTFTPRPPRPEHASVLSS